MYRGRAFLVYWIGSWLLIAASLMLRAQGYEDLRLGSVMLGLGQLLSVWSAGLTLLAANAFPDGLGLSIGVASASVEAENLAEAIRLADGRMYRDKLGERQ